MSEDVEVLRDESRVYDDGTVARVRVLAIPESDRFPVGLKYAMHYGYLDSDDPIVRIDNHHGPHELHQGTEVWEIDFPGFETLYRIWLASLPAEKRTDW
jgi:hypothetical protein